MQHTNFQASESSGSEVEDFKIFFYVYLWFKHKTLWGGAILHLGTFILINLVKNY